MKIRTNYVSNSSSSSFCVMGVVMSEEDARLKAIELLKANNEPLKDNVDYYHVLEKFLGVEVTYGIYDYYEQIILGLSHDVMRDDETLLQFKQRVFDSVKSVGFEFGDIGWHVDGGYNG